MAEAKEKAKAACKVQEAREKTERDEKAERVCLANWKRLEWELIEFKEQNEAEAKRKAEEKEKHQAGDGMMLATPVDLLSLERARIVNAEKCKGSGGGFQAATGREQQGDGNTDA
jgi:hypothetical protein